MRLECVWEVVVGVGGWVGQGHVGDDERQGACMRRCEFASLSVRGLVLCSICE